MIAATAERKARERTEKNRNAAFWCEDRSTNAFLNGDKHAFFKSRKLSELDDEWTIIMNKRVSEMSRQNIPDSI